MVDLERILRDHEEILWKLDEGIFMDLRESSGS
jgi:hypothetical protein